MTYKTLRDEIRAVREIQRCYNGRIEQMLTALWEITNILSQRVSEFEEENNETT